MRFTVLLSYFVRFLYVILCGFAVFVLSLRPPLTARSKRCYSLGTVAHLSEEENEGTIVGRGGGSCKGYFCVVKGGYVI